MTARRPDLPVASGSSVSRAADLPDARRSFDAMWSAIGPVVADLTEAT